MKDRAVSSNVGLVLLLALTIVGAGVVVAIGGTAFDDVQHRTSVDRAEHAMTLLDARTAVVGLGEGSTQTVRLGRTTSGDYAAESDSGWLRITHTNYTADETETIYNASLGSVSYRTGGTTVAYQGGGVWRHQEGGTSMVSPPEFHYRGTTLTLPVLRVRSEDAAAGETTATIRRDGELARIYPTEADTATDGTGAPYDVNTTDDTIRQYDNPVRNGTVSVTVHSEYYQGWAEYFRTRTTGNVSVDDANRTATVALETSGQPGAFQYPGNDGSIPIRGIAEGHSVNDFQTSVRSGSGGNPGGGNPGGGNPGGPDNFNKLYVSYYAEEGDRAYEAIVKVPAGIGGSYCKNGRDDVDLRMDIYYHDESTAEGVHRWTNDEISSVSGPIQLACEGESPVLRMDFTSPNQNLTYGSSSVNEDTGVNWEARDDGSYPDSITFAHDGDEDDGGTTYDNDDEENLRILTRHYFAKFGSDFDLRAHNNRDQKVDAPNSGGILRYDTGGGGSYITYLHVTENNVTVELN